MPHFIVITRGWLPCRYLDTFWDYYKISRLVWSRPAYRYILGFLYAKTRRALEWSTYLAVGWIEIIQLRGKNLGPKLHPGGGLFGPWSFIIKKLYFYYSYYYLILLLFLKKLHQDLSNEGSNFILSSLEVGHWVAQTQPFLTNYLKLQILASYKNLRIEQDSEFAKFWQGIFLKFYKDWVSLCSIVRVKSFPLSCMCQKIQCSLHSGALLGQENSRRYPIFGVNCGIYHVAFGMKSKWCHFPSPK
jgi:hypothetical protein